VISHIDNIDLNLSIAENFAAACPDVHINKYLTLVAGWDNIDIESTQISPNDALSNKFPADPKNMLISDDYKKILDDELQKLSVKKTRGKKVEQNEEDDMKAKKVPKPRGKKAPVGKVSIEKPASEKLSFT
jgi:hypothetical protein